MQVILKNYITNETLEFMSPTLEIGNRGQFIFQSNMRDDSNYALELSTLTKFTHDESEVSLGDSWSLVSITDDVAFLWNRNDVADVYRNNFNDPSLAPSKEEADNIIETLNEKDDLNHAVRMAILEEINYYLGENDENYYLYEGEKDNG